MKPRNQNFVNGALATELEPIARAAWPAREKLGGGRLALPFHRRLFAPRQFGSGTCLCRERRPRGRDRSCGVGLCRARPGAHVPHHAHFGATRLGVLRCAHGYAPVCLTTVMVADLANVLNEAGDPGEIRFVNRGDGDFARLVVEGSHSVADGNERLDILSRVGSKHACIVALGEGAPASCGLAVAQGGWAGFFLMRTNPRQRRHGHARRVLAALARWAKDAGAVRGYLQVEDDNLPARALYARAGFADAYGYRFCAQGSWARNRG